MSWIHYHKSAYVEAMEHLLGQKCQHCDGTGREPGSPDDKPFWECHCTECKGDGFRQYAVRRTLKLREGKTSVSIANGVLEVDINEAMLNAIDEAGVEDLLGELFSRKEVLEYAVEKLQDDWGGYGHELDNARRIFLDSINANRLKALIQYWGSRLQELAGKVQDNAALKRQLDTFVRWVEDQGVEDAWRQFNAIARITDPLPTSLERGWWEKSGEQWRNEVRSLLSECIPVPAEKWHEDMGDVVWWKLPVEEAPYVGRPTDSGWIDEYYTHFTRLPQLVIVEV